MKRATIITLALLVVVSSYGQAPADTPSRMTVQGKLTDPGGAPEVGTFTFRFKIFETPVAGFEVWPGPIPEDQVITTDANGLWVAQLGEDSPLTDASFEGTDRWLEIRVDDGVNPPETLSRIKLTTNPFSYRVSTIDRSSGGFVMGETAFQRTGAPDDQMVIGVSDPNVALELRSGASNGTPFIDFVNDNVSDFDARIQLTADGVLGVTGELDVSGMENKIRFHYNDFADLPSPSTYHGMFAHVHNDNKAYYAHAGSWVPLADEAHAHNAGTILDEPGVAQQIAAGFGLSVGVQDITSRSITVPAAGYVLAMGSCRVAVGHVNGTTSQTRLGVSATSATFPSDQDKEFRIPSSAMTDLWVTSLSPLKIFSVPAAGSVTYYLVGNLVSGSATVNEITFSLVYFPTAYGTVTE